MADDGSNGNRSGKWEGEWSPVSKHQIQPGCGEGLPVGRVGAAAAVDCSCCRTCDVINTSPPTRDRKKKEEQSNSGVIIPPPPQETEKRRSNIFVSAQEAVLAKENGQNSRQISSSKRKEESRRLILKGKIGDKHKRVDE